MQQISNITFQRAVARWNELEKLFIEMHSHFRATRVHIINDSFSTQNGRTISEASSAAAHWQKRKQMFRHKTGDLFN